MLDVFNTAKPTGCDIQTFYGAQGKNVVFSWVKPRGVSNIYILLIGGGGNGDGSATGGGSGAVSVWYGAASNVPDNLRLNISTSSSTVQYYTSSVSTLLTALASVNTTGAAASAATAFTASGFYKSTAGQDGSTGTTPASGTTFLSGGGTNTGIVQSNYNYLARLNGFFQMQPIIVGVGGSGSGIGGYGCGNGATNTALGGPGLVLIASW